MKTVHWRVYPFCSYQRRLPMRWHSVNLVSTVGVLAVLMMPHDVQAQAGCWTCNGAKTQCRDFASSGTSGCEVVNEHCVPSGNQCGIAGGGGNQFPPLTTGSEDPYLVYGAIFVASNSRALPPMFDGPVVRETLVARGGPRTRGSHWPFSG